MYRFFCHTIFFLKGNTQILDVALLEIIYLLHLKLEIYNFSQTVCERRLVRHNKRLIS